MNDNQTPTNPGRRRLAKGGLAVPVVLASLTSNNAFAALPYRCFVSGKLSGNMSPFGPNARSVDQSCSLPQSRGQVQSNLAGDMRTFGSVFGGVNVYVNGTGGSSGLTLSPGSSAGANAPATLLQVLTLSNAGDSPVQDLETLRQGVVVYENARNFPPPNDLVPLTTQQVVEFVQAVKSGSGVVVTTSIGAKNFSNAEVKAYLSELSVSV